MRREEIRQLTTAITEESLDGNSWSRNLVVLGDFNIGSPSDEAWQDLCDQGVVIPDFVADIRGTNIAQDKYYDQIAIRPRDGWFEIANLGPGRPSAGAFNLLDVVYRPNADTTPISRRCRPTGRTRRAATSSSTPTATRARTHRSAGGIANTGGPTR